MKTHLQADEKDTGRAPTCGIKTVPKSVEPSRIRSNFDIFDFRLPDVEMAMIDGLDTGLGSGPDPQAVDAGLFPPRVDPLAAPPR
ncbi:MAG: hypothetical protein Tsb0019_20700 [Roseibium sp.]